MVMGTRNLDQVPRVSEQPPGEWGDRIITLIVSHIRSLSGCRMFPGDGKTRSRVVSALPGDDERFLKDARH